MATETARRNENTGGQAQQRAAQRVEDTGEDFQTMVNEIGTAVNAYAKERPGMAGLMVFAIGFYVGWKIKPW